MKTITVQLVIDLLKHSLGIEKSKSFSVRHHDLDHLFGRWPEDEFQMIQGKIDGERKIDPKLW